MVTIYTLAGGDMYYQTFNAIAALVGSTSWDSLIRIGLVISVVVYVARYIMHRDPTKFLKWIFVYLFIATVAIAPKKTVEIVDLTTPTNNRIVDNVPVGLALLLNITSTVGYAVAQTFDTFFSLPDDQELTNNGIMFGANIVKNSLNPPPINADYQNKVVTYIQSCVVGDILLNHKYTVGELVNSTDIANLIFNGNPSPVRMTEYDGDFITCQKAADRLLKYNIENKNDKEGIGLSEVYEWLASPFTSGNSDNNSVRKTNAKELLMNTYNYMFKSSKDASEILNQNTLIHLTSKGLKNFAAVNDDVGSLVSIAKEESQMKTRLNWAVTTQIATTYLPLIHTVLTLLVIGFFPIIIILTLTDLVGLSALKMYVYSFIYLLSWMPLFSILNNIMTFYTQQRLGHFGTPTLSNINQIDLQLSDIGMIAGFMSMSIPYIAHMITKGVMGATYQAYGSLMGAINSDTAQTTSQVATGNYNRGNMSYNNVNGNKWDTNQTHYSGQSSFNDGYGGIQTMTENGNYYQAQQSSLGTNVDTGKNYSNLLSESLRKVESDQASISEQFGETANATYNATHDLLHSNSHASNLGSSTDNANSIARTRAIDEAKSIAENYAKSHNMTTSEAERFLIEAGVGGNYGLFSASAKGSYELSHSNSNSKIDTETRETAKHFREATEKAERLSHQNTGGDSNSHGDTSSNRIASGYGKMDSISENWNESKSIQENLGNELSLSESNNAGFQTNLNNGFLSYLKETHADDWQSIVNDPSRASAKHALAGEFLQHRVDEISGNFQSNKQELHNQYVADKSSYTHNGVVDLNEMTSAYNAKIDQYIKENTGIMSDKQIDDGVQKLFSQYEMERKKVDEQQTEFGKSIQSGKDFGDNEYYVKTVKLGANVPNPNGGYSRQIMVGYDKWDGKSEQSHLYKQDGKGGYTEVPRKDTQKPSSKVK